MTPFNTLSLGDLISQLQRFDYDSYLRFDFCNFSPGTLISYRGWYDHLAIIPTTVSITVGDFIKTLEEAIGVEFAAYKGGLYKMDKHTPIWVSQWGDVSNTAIRKVISDHYTIIRTKHIKSN